MENMSETSKAGINTCYRMLLQLRSAKSAGDVASALFDGRVTKADGSSGVRFLRDNGTTIQSLRMIDISDIDTVFRELAAGQTSTLDDILARAADFYGIK